MSKLDKEQVIADFTAAYKAANGKEPSIEAKGGWFSVDGGKNMRLAALEEMTAELGGSSASASKEEKPTTAEPKAAKKPAAKKPAAKKAAAKPKKASGFSVKAFWSEQLKANDPAAKLPR